MPIARVAALAALIAAPTLAQDGPLVVYSPHGEDMMALVASRFTEETGIEVEYLTMGGGELIDRVRAEAANPVADVLYGNPSSVFMELKEEGLLEAHTPPWAEALESYFKDEDGVWHGTIQTPVVLFYNAEMLSAEEAPADWLDLTDERFADDIVIRSTTSAASRAAHAALAYQFDKRDALDGEGWDWFAALDGNIKRYVPDSGLMFQAIGRKEAAVGFWTLSGVTDNRDQNDLPLEIVDAASGSPVITDAIAVVAGTDRLEAAARFVDFAGSEPIQVALAEEFGRMPTLPAALEDAPEWMSAFEYTVMDVDWGRLAEMQSPWIRKIEDEIRDGAKVAGQ